MDNIILLTDSYKITHFAQYPPGTQKVYSYFESRGGPYPVLFFGLQYYLTKYLEGVRVTNQHIADAMYVIDRHLGTSQKFNKEGWQYIADRHGGKLPVVIKAVPEGMVVPNHNVLMTIENTDPKCWWLTNYLETLLVQVWYACTVASQSREMKQTLLEFLEETGDPGGIAFKLHDFGFRGVSSVESAGIGGAAHLVNFTGTDTIPGLLVAMQYYEASMPGFSIPASEHSTITSWGRAREGDAFENMLDQYPDGLVACVSDSYDIHDACRTLWGGRLRDKILSRNGCLVVRPDSGEPSEIVVEVLNILGEKFGYETNAKGYKVLDPHVRVIQGDGIDMDSLPGILFALKDAGWSIDNVAFGSGGGLLQKLNRDTLKFAFKCSSVTVNDDESDVYKEPKTDSGKQSKRGRLKLVCENGVYSTRKMHEPGEDLLQEVFRDGDIKVKHKFHSIIGRAK